MWRIEDLEFGLKGGFNAVAVGVDDRVCKL